ncbi:hypothetical protein V8E36_008764 [Tilletia maclaganii]
MASSSTHVSRVSTHSSATAVGSPTVPPVLSAWLRGRYPTFPVRQEWLEGCVEYLLESGQGRLSDRELIRQTNTQLLHADLADSAEAGVLSEDMLTMHRQRLGDKSHGVLLQIVGIMDIGVSAQTQMDVLTARQEARAVPPSTRSTFVAHAPGPSSSAPAYGGDDPEEQDHMSAFHDSESALASQANPTVYPRSLLRLHLSDGHSDVLLPAFEHTRMEALSMNDPGEGPVGLAGKGRTLLGCKVLLKGPEVRRGQVLLRPGDVEILGGSIPELEARSEYLLRNSLRLRLGKSPEPEANGTQQAQ